MNLDDAQRKKVAEWIKQGLKLSEIQSRIASELGLHLTYMDVRLLVDDLKLTPKDVEQPKTAAGVLSAPGAPTAASKQAGAPQAAGPAPGPGSVSVDVDQVARPGARLGPHQQKLNQVLALVPQLGARRPVWKRQWGRLAPRGHPQQFWAAPRPWVSASDHPPGVGHPCR